MTTIDRTGEIPAAVAGTGDSQRVTADTMVETPARLEPASAAADHRSGFALLGLGLGVLGAAVQLVPSGHVRLFMLLAFLLLGPGAAVMSAARVPDRLTAWALAVTGSMTVATGVAVTTLWMHVWNPDVTVASVAAAVTLVSAGRLITLWRAGGRAGNPFALPLRDRPPRAPGRRARIRGILPMASVAGAVLLWAYALKNLRPAGVGLYGLTAALGWPFLVAVVLLGTGLAAEILGRARPVVLGVSLLAVPLMMQATVPLLDGTIEYAWTYKHVGVVDLVLNNGHLLNSNDIYQQWPGFFAVLAMMSHVAGVGALSFAAWSSLTFALINMLVVAALLRAFGAGRRVVVLGVLLSQIAMWVDIGYFSPQAFVYPLMLSFWLIVVRWLLVVPPAPTGTPRVVRVRTWLLRGLPEQPVRSRREQAWAGAGAVALFAAITVSHQLTPFVMLLPLAVLVVLGVVRPRVWLPLTLIAVLAAFVGPRLGGVASQYHLFDFDLVANAAGNADTWRTPEQEFSALVARTLAIGVWLAALAGVWLRIRRPGRVLVPAVLGFVPIVTLAGGNYGGEAIYRVFAFSLPFAALLIADLWAGPRYPARLLVGRIRRRLVVGASGLVLAAIMLAALQGLQGQLVVHQVSRTDIAAAEYLYAHAEPDSSIVLAAPNFPTKLTADYDQFNTKLTAVDVSLIGDPHFDGNLNASRVTDIEAYVRALGTRTSYLVVSDAMENYTEYFGLSPAGSMTSLGTGLRNSGDWTVFYAAPGITVFRLTPVS